MIAATRMLQPRQILADLSAGVALVSGLPPFLRRPIEPGAASAVVRDRLARRADDFLALMRREIFDRPDGPYRALLRHAGCEAGDLERRVRADGVEGALATLARGGVYLTLYEFRGRSVIRRGSLTLAMTATDVTTGSARRALVHRTSGTGGGPTPLPLALPFEADHAVNACLFLAARGNQGWRHALWEVPGGAALRHVLWLSGLGQPPAAWFSQVDPGRDLPARYAWSWRAVKAAALLGGTRIPRPRTVPIEDPVEILGWMRHCLDNGVVPHLWTFVTSAVRVCQAAETRGVRLDGVQFTANGEPITAGRVAAVARTGARMGGYYGSIETGPLGYACLAPVSADEMHVLGDLHAVWHADGSPALPGLPTDAVLVSSLRATAPVLLVNVALGDRAARLERRCGCPVEACGWTGRLHSIRSYARVSVGGMTFFDTDLVAVLEEALPAHFGGGPTDYQLIEEATADGRAGLRLIVSPSVGPLDPAAVTRTFLDALGRAGGAAQVMSSAWRHAGAVLIERRAPAVGVTGKIAHFRSASTPAPRPS
jgi:hypothetical protein